MFRRCRQKFIAALGQVRGEFEEIVHALARDIDIAKELDKTPMKLHGEHGAVEQEASRYIWEISLIRRNRRRTTRFR